MKTPDYWNTCTYCEKEFSEDEKRCSVRLKGGRFVVSPAGGEGPLHENCAAKVAKARNGEK